MIHLRTISQCNCLAVKCIRFIGPQCAAVNLNWAGNGIRAAAAQPYDAGAGFGETLCPGKNGVDAVALTIDHIDHGIPSGGLQSQCICGRVYGVRFGRRRRALVHCIGKFDGPGGSWAVESNGPVCSNISLTEIRNRIYSVGNNVGGPIGRDAP